MAGEQAVSEQRLRAEISPNQMKSERLMLVGMVGRKEVLNVKTLKQKQMCGR